jgi:ABC-type amino acid transport substrate-binding protein
MRFFILVMGLLSAYPASAQISFPLPKPPGHMVTVLSDALSEPAGEASQILNGMSVSLDKEGAMRLLSVSGYGGPANVRDLLQLRGTDLAIVNNDVLAYLDLAKTLPEARRKVRLVSPLSQQGAFLFGRKNIASISDLKGRKIGVPAMRPSRGITARTVLGLLKIDASVVELDAKELPSKASSLDALLLYEEDLPGLQPLGITSESHHLLPVLVKGPLAETYSPKKLGKATLGGISTNSEFETIQVTTVLAVYDWRETDARYAEVVSFANKFFSFLPHFRAAYPNSLFSRTDVRMNLPGWKRFGPAETMAAAVPPVSIKEDNTPRLAPAPEGTVPADAIRVVAAARPPFANAQDRDGGVVLKILAGALGEAGVPFTVHWVDSERAMLDALTSKTADAGLFWQTPHCDMPVDPSASEARTCDTTDLTDPLIQAVIAVFTRPDPAGPNAAAKNRTVCIPESQTVPAEALAAMPWIAGASVKTIRPKTLIDCLAAVDRSEADALIALEPEARFAIERLKLAQTLQVSQTAGITTGLHALVAKDNPRQAQLIQTINEALAKFKSGGGYTAVITSHLADLAGVSVKRP